MEQSYSTMKLEVKTPDFILVSYLIHSCQVLLNITIRYHVNVWKCSNNVSCDYIVPFFLKCQKSLVTDIVGKEQKLEY